MTALPTLLIISSVIFEIAVAVALAAYLITNANVSARSSAEALSAAQAGANDAAIRIARNKSYEATTGYSFVVGSSTVNVVVTANTGQGGGAATGKTRVLSTGTTKNFSKRIEAVYTINDNTGELTLESYEETAI